MVKSLSDDIPKLMYMLPEVDSIRPPRTDFTGSIPVKGQLKEPMFFSNACMMARFL